MWFQTFKLHSNLSGWTPAHLWKSKTSRLTFPDSISWIYPCFVQFVCFVVFFFKLHFLVKLLITWSMVLRYQQLRLQSINIMKNMWNSIEMSVKPHQCVKNSPCTIYHIYARLISIGISIVYVRTVQLSWDCKPTIKTNHLRLSAQFHLNLICVVRQLASFGQCHTGRSTSEVDGNVIRLASVWS